MQEPVSRRAKQGRGYTVDRGPPDRWGPSRGRKWPCSGRSNGKKSFFTAVSCVQQNPLESTSRVSPPRLQRRAEPHWVVRASPGVLSAFPRKKESRCFSQGHRAQPPAAPRQRLPWAAVLPAGAGARLRAPGPWNDRATPRALVRAHREHSQDSSQGLPWSGIWGVQHLHLGTGPSRRDRAAGFSEHQDRAECAWSLL